MDTSNKESISIKNLTVTGLMIAFTFVAGSIIKIPTLNGMIQLGDCMVLLSGVLLGKRYGTVAGALGMALVDICAGYVLWAPFTFVIKGLMAFAVAAIVEKVKEPSHKTFLIAFSIGGVINIVGYFISNAIMGGVIVGASNGFIGSLIYALAHMPGDIFQTVAGIIIALLLVNVVYKIKERIF